MGNKLKETTDEAVQRLRDRLGSVKCPMCKKGPFIYLNGIVPILFQESLKQVDLTVESSPCIVIMCRNCGFMSQHNILALDISADKLKETE